MHTLSARRHLLQRNRLMTSIDPFKTDISTASAIDVKVANRFYKQQGYHGRARKGDTLVRLRSQQHLLGICRISMIEQSLLMRNLCIAVSHRKQGLGKHLLVNLKRHINNNLYAFPFAELLSLYLTCGWQLIDSKTLTATLGSMYQSYQRKYPSLRIAVLEPNHSPL